MIYRSLKCRINRRKQLGHPVEIRDDNLGLFGRAVGDLPFRILIGRNDASVDSVRCIRNVADTCCKKWALEKHAMNVWKLYEHACRWRWCTLDTIMIFQDWGQEKCPHRRTTIVEIWLMVRARISRGWFWDINVKVSQACHLRTFIQIRALPSETEFNHTNDSGVYQLEESLEYNLSIEFAWQPLLEQGLGILYIAKSFKPHSHSNNILQYDDSTQGNSQRLTYPSELRLLEWLFIFQGKVRALFTEKHAFLPNPGGHSAVSPALLYPVAHGHCF